MLQIKGISGCRRLGKELVVIAVIFGYYLVGTVTPFDATFWQPVVFVAEETELQLRRG